MAAETERGVRCVTRENKPIFPLVVRDFALTTGSMGGHAPSQQASIIDHPGSPWRAVELEGTLSCGNGSHSPPELQWIPATKGPF